MREVLNKCLRLCYNQSKGGVAMEVYEGSVRKAGLSFFSIQIQREDSEGPLKRTQDQRSLCMESDI